MRSLRSSPNAVVSPSDAATMGWDLGVPSGPTGLWVLATHRRTGGSCAQDDTLSWHLAVFLGPPARPTLNIRASDLPCARTSACTALRYSQSTIVSLPICS